MLKVKSYASIENVCKQIWILKRPLNSFYILRVIYTFNENDRFIKFGQNIKNDWENMGYP